MCWICDHPGATEGDYTEHMRRLTPAHGWAWQGVERDGIHPPWAYTVGLTSHRRPELVITGMGLTRATAVLNGMAAHPPHADEPEPGAHAAARGARSWAAGSRPSGASGSGSAQRRAGVRSIAPQFTLRSALASSCVGRE